ncbi:unnamed protein product [Linum trigynum]|uniref:Uncharacterized protein n=1 Tax=Linum trigynum TaxID=586398 RepID=A0AAV2GX34_9ROSI
MASPTIGGIHHHPTGITPRLPRAIKEEKTMDSGSSTNPLTTENNRTPGHIKNNVIIKKNFSHNQKGHRRWSYPWRPSRAILQSHDTLHSQIKTMN